MTPRHPERPLPPLAMVLQACLLVGAFGTVSGCQDRVQPASTPAPTEEQRAAGHQMSPEEMAAMGASTSGRTASGDGELDVAPERLQSIGVKFERAVRRSLDREVRTVGRVVIDERRLARVNVKIEGWIDQLYVNTTGQSVTKGQSLFTLYSPEIVATQEEFLLALRSAQTLGGSNFPEVAEGAKSLLESSRRRLQLWDIADSHIRELERSGKILRTLPIYAPLGGTVIEKMAVAGMRVMPGEDLYVIADLSHVWILADIYEYELPFIQLGQTAQITLSYDAASLMDGDLTFVYPTLDPATRTARVRFELDNPGGKLKPDMYVNVALTVPLGERLVVPKDAVLETGQRQIMFVRRGGGKLAWREVKIGARAGDWVEIVDGLSEGEEIVTSANFLIDSESQVKGAMAGMAGMDMPGNRKQQENTGDAGSVQESVR
ncbi:MAG: efflux RND transporter periplasmic adaptor subunit [Gammaproteobacteria bacterium]|nr:efflux RND transporter periplasmic adaptor subunit [Gammaproteobacteria bacterium]